MKNLQTAPMMKGLSEEGGACRAPQFQVLHNFADVDVASKFIALIKQK